MPVRVRPGPLLLERAEELGLNLTRDVRIGVVPKSTRNPYFEDCRRGAQEAAQELGFTLLWDGPPQVDAGRQAEIVETWAREGVPATRSAW
jgi:ABC-type sugar transport system substrate-binding protein